MRPILMSLALLAAGTGPALADATVGQPAPAFSLPDTGGQTHALADYQGRVVVLEWVNYECPFVRKHYDSTHMQRLQKDYTARGVVWLQVNSSAPGKQGHYPAPKAASLTQKNGAASTAYLLDPTGIAGRAYGAQTTPHMFVIDPGGRLVYAGGIDDTPSTDVADIPRARNFVSAALDEVLAGKPVTVSTSAPYGCSVKY